MSRSPRPRKLQPLISCCPHFGKGQCDHPKQGTSFYLEFCCWRRCRVRALFPFSSALRFLCLSSFALAPQSLDPAPSVKDVDVLTLGDNENEMTMTSSSPTTSFYKKLLCFTATAAETTAVHLNLSCSSADS